MKKLKISYFFIYSYIIFILLSGFVLAQEPDVFNPDDPFSFDYINGDYTTISDWSKVNWDSIDYTNPSLNLENIPIKYADKVDAVKAIIAGKGMQLTVEQIAYNLENIENLATDVKEERAREAIQRETGVYVVSLGKSAKIEKGVLKATFGEEGALDFEGKTNWEIEINEEGIIRVLKPNKIKEEVISQQDHFYLAKETRITTEEGKEITALYLSYKGKQPYVRKSKTAYLTYEGRKLNLETTFNEVKVYFEKFPSLEEENYVLWEGDRLSLAGSGFQVEFPKKSGFFLRETDTGLLPLSYQKMKVVLKPEGGIINFNFKDLKPRIEVKGKARIQNGKYELVLREGKIMSNLYNFKEEQVGKAAGMRINYLSEEGTEKLNFNDDGELDYGNSKHFEMAWSGDIKRDVDKILSDLKDRSPVESKGLMVWLETDSYGGLDDWGFDISKEIMVDTMAANDILVIPISMGQFKAEQNKKLLDELYYQRKKGEVGLSIFGHSIAAINTRTWKEELWNNWDFYKSRISEEDRELAKLVLESQVARVRGEHFEIPSQYATSFIKEKTRLTEETLKAYLKKKGMTQDEVAQSYKEFKSRHTVHKILIEDKIVEGKHVATTYNIPKNSPIPIGCSWAEAAMGRDMKPEESALLTIAKIHNYFRRTNTPNWVALNKELREGTYKFPSDDSAKQFENFLNSHQTKGLPEMNWCVGTKTKRC